MFAKIQLLVLIVFAFVFGCKSLDYGALDDGVAKPTSAWALVDLFLLAPSSEGGAKKGQIQLRLGEELRHESNFGGINTTFMASESLVFAAPDVATNEAIPDSDTALINMVSIELVDAKDRFVCPEGSGAVANLVHSADESISEAIIFQATDLACGGNKLVKLNKLIGGIDELGFVPSHTWKSADTARAKGVLQDVEAFYAKENKEGGALQKTQHEETNELIDIFLMRRKMLNGYVEMREEINSHANLEEMAKAVFRANDPDAKHVVIPEVLNGFLNPQVNKADPEDTTTADSDDFDTILMQEALLSSVLKFLQYQEMFQAEEFKSSEYANKFIEEKNKFTGDLRTYIDEVEKQFNDSIAEKPIKVYRNVSDVVTPLHMRLNNLNTFLKNKESCAEYTCRKEGGDNCLENTPGSGECEDLTPRFYGELLAPACVARGEDKEDSPLYALLITAEIMGATRINDPCKKYNEAAPLRNIEKSQDVIKGVVALKKRTIENLETLAEIHKPGGGSNFRQKLFENHYYTVIPAVTKYPDKAAEVAVDLKVAHDKVYEKRKKDEFWQGVSKILAWTAAATGVLAIGTAFLPPLAGIFGFLTATTTVASVTVSAATVMGAMSVVAGVSLLVVSMSDYVNEKREFQELERAIYGGGQANAAAQAAALREWKQSRNDSIIEGLALFVAARPATVLLRKGPEGFKAGAKWLGRGAWQTVRHPVKSVKGLGRRTKEMFTGQHLLGFKRGAKQADELNLLLVDDVVRIGDDVADGLRGATKHVQQVRTELVKYNQAVQAKASMVKDLKKLRKSFFGIGKPRGRSRVTDSGDVFFSVKKDGLPNRRFNKIEKFFKEKAEQSGGKLKFEHLEEGGRHRFRLLHANRDVALKRAQLMKLQEKLGKGIPRVEPDGSMHFLVNRAGTPPAQWAKINEVFKPQQGFRLEVVDFGEFRKYSLIPKAAP